MEANIAIFGEINQQLTENFINSLNPAFQNPEITSLKINFSSVGGDLSCAFFLYNFLRDMQRKYSVHMCNFGTIESIANIIFLAADKRTMLPYSRFLFHELNWFFPTGNVPRSKLREHVDSLDFDVERYVAIFEERTQGATTPFNVRSCLCGVSRVLDANDALAAGIVSEIIG